MSVSIQKKKRLEREIREKNKQKQNFRSLKEKKNVTAKILEFFQCKNNGSNFILFLTIFIILGIRRLVYLFLYEERQD